jgi:hypothetical protein
MIPKNDYVYTLEKMSIFLEIHTKMKVLEFVLMHLATRERRKRKEREKAEGGKEKKKEKKEGGEGASKQTVITALNVLAKLPNFVIVIVDSF